uniref:Uncharacterized protein n=1 Tax=Elaeophora elaphi TaxID=1147741 RepID=A0A0R3RTS2_9BILA
MLSVLVCFSIIAVVCSTEAPPKRNISNTVKNETGEGHWYPRQSSIYGEMSPFSYLYGYPTSSYYPYTTCYPPTPCANTVPLSLDQFYCSAHGSFALGTGNPSNKLMREFCRFTATSSESSCNTCCKVAARHYTTSADEVSGIIFSFDPNMPPAKTHPKPHHTSFLRKKRAVKTATSAETNPTKSAVKRQNVVNLAISPGLIPIGSGSSIIHSSSDIPQCFCCAPMRSIHSF